MAELKQKGWWAKKTTFQKVCFIISAILFVAALALFFIMMHARPILGNETADQLYRYPIGTDEETGETLYKTFAHGWALVGYVLASSALHWLVTIMIVFVTFILIFVSNFITHLFDNKSKKSKTISSLIRSLVKYGMMLIALALILIIWGVNVAGVLAGVGVITLIVGLGCQSLIQDVISGLFIVFDDYFGVGDTVIIDGFRGTIVEVGLKTTKLQDFGGNIKSITNSSISTVVNMSRMRSVSSVTLSVSYNEDVERVEAIILKEIEDIKEKVPNITEGPWYKGIDSISASSINFLVLCYVDESNRFQVTRDMNREFYLAFKKNNVQIPYTQVTVNGEDEKNTAKATPEEVALAVREQKILRGTIDKEPKKKASKKARVIKKIQQSYEQAQKDMD